LFVYSLFDPVATLQGSATIMMRFVQEVGSARRHLLGTATDKGWLFGSLVVTRPYKVVC